MRALLFKISWLVSLGLLALTPLLAQPALAQPTAQAETIPILATDALSERVSRQLANAYAEANTPAFTVTRDSDATIAALCAGEAGILATITPPADQSECEDVIELMVALDGAVVVAAEGVDFLSCLTPDQLLTVFGAAGPQEAVRWNQVNPDFPDRAVSVYVPNLADDTEDFFNQQILGEAGVRSNNLGLSTDPLRNLNSRQSAIGYVPAQTYLSDPRAFQGVPLDNGTECVSPNRRSIADGDYLTARPIFWYVSASTAYDRAAILELLELAYSDAGLALIAEAGAGFPPDNMRALSLVNFTTDTTGMMMSHSDGEPHLVVRLSWNSGHDLDLSLRLPDGAEVSFENNANGGFVRNADNGYEYCNSTDPAPSEHITSLTAQPPPAGTYLAIVQQSFNCLDEGEQASFTLEFIVNGQVEHAVNGTIGPEPATFAEGFGYAGE